MALPPLSRVLSRTTISTALLAACAMALPGQLAAHGCASHSQPKAEKAKDHGKTIVETAVGDGRFTILAQALQTAGLVDALNGSGPLTVFAPTDEAFKKLPAGTLESLTKEQLTAILKAHVVAGKIKAKDAIAADGKSVDSLGGAKLAVKVVDGSVTIAGSTVVAADVKASNGVIHVIDTVIIPN